MRKDNYKKKQRERVEQKRIEIEGTRELAINALQFLWTFSKPTEKMSPLVESSECCELYYRRILRASRDYLIGKVFLSFKNPFENFLHKTLVYCISVAFPVAKEYTYYRRIIYQPT
jgi:hypothetical protein